MRIKIINPNTTQAMTDGIKKAAVGVARDDTEIICVSPERGPVSIENTHDEAYASIGVIEEVRKGFPLCPRPRSRRSWDRWEDLR